MEVIMKTFYEVLDQMKAEINADIAAGKVPATVKSFSELHDYVDANCYGGFCDDNGSMDELIAKFGGRDENEGMPDGAMQFINDAQNLINSWLEAGRG
jgi:hypothetical protein